MICVADKRAARVRMYTAFNLTRFLMRRPAWNEAAAQSIVLVPDQPIGGEPPSADAIGLGPPIVDFTVADLADSNHRNLLRDCIAEWVEREHENLNRRKVGLTIAIGYTEWVANQLPNAVHLFRDHCFGPHGAKGAHKVIAEAATLIALLEKRGGGKKGERDALAAYLKEFTEIGVYPEMWSRVMDC